MKNCFLFLAFVFIYSLYESSSCMAESLPKIILQEQTVRYNGGNNIMLLEDQDGSLQFHEVLAMDSVFQASHQEIPVYGPSSSTIWCRLNLHNKSNEVDWYLEVGNSYLNQVDLYEPLPDGGYKITKAGIGEPFESREIKSNRIILPLQLAHDTEKTYYLRVQSRNILRFPIHISTMPALYEANHQYDLANGIYFGLMGALVIFNLFVFFSLRDPAYLMYIMYILCLALDIASIRGYILEWLPEPFMWLVHNRVFSGLTIFFGVAFANTFLQTKTNLPGLFKWSWVIYASVTMIFILSLLQYYVWSFAWMLLTLIPGFIYIYIASIISYRRGFQPALFLTIAFGAMGMGVAIYALKDNNILPENNFTESAMQMGSVIEAIVLSFALAIKFKYFKNEVHQAQELAIKQANAFSQSLIQSQEYERKRIAAELHDSVGQSLIVIKNKVLMLKKWFNEPEKVTLYADGLAESVSHTINEVRTISYALRPFQLDMLGMSQSIQSLADEISESSGISVTVEMDDIDGFFPKADEINLYRIVQECLNNIVKHSEATQAKVSLSKNGEVVQLKIEDNGKGMPASFNISEKKNGFGLLGIQERINILKGNWIIKEAAPFGTLIHISIPISLSHANT